MKIPNDIVQAKKKGIFRKIMWGLLILPFLILIFFNITLEVTNANFEGNFVLLFFLLQAPILFILSITSKKYYNWTPIFLMIFLLTILPGEKFKFYLGLHNEFFAFVSLFFIFHLIISSVRSIFVLQQNNFVKIMGIASSILLANFIFVYFSGKFQYGSYISSVSMDILNNIINLLLLMITLILIIKLPSTNFSSWLSVERKIFYRQILLPLGAIIILSIFYNVFPDAYMAFITSESNFSHYGMKDLQLFDFK